MKIGIVTIYKCYNYGSFYQAYGLYKYLEDLGHDVEFIKLDTTYNIKYRLRRQFTRDVKRDIFSLKLISGYVKDWGKYKIASGNSTDYDLVIIGSDEIWNINNKSFTCLPEYYGLNINCENIISYASCVGRAVIDDFDDHKDLIDGIRSLEAVSARDGVTQEFLSQIREDNNIQRVIDPSFLIDWRAVEKPCKRKDFILVYTYDGYWGFSDEFIKASKDFAKSVNLPLICVGFRNTWCDEYTACSPCEFLGYLRNATYVITDTFHGSAMSIQYNKQFVCMGEGKAKTDSLLEEFDLVDRRYNGSRELSEIFSNNIDYSVINQTIKEKTMSSKDYLNRFIK